MVKDAEAHAEDDRRQREVVEARNAAENAAYQAERQVAEMGDSLDSSSKEEIEAAIKDVRENLESDDVDLLRQKTDALQAAFHKVSEQMYAAAAAQQQQAANGAPADGAAGRRLRRRGGGRGRRGGRGRGEVLAMAWFDETGRPEEDASGARSERFARARHLTRRGRRARRRRGRLERGASAWPRRSEAAEAEDPLARARASATSTSTWPAAPRPTSRTTASARPGRRRPRASAPSGGLVRELLPVVDNLERALARPRRVSSTWPRACGWSTPS